MNITITETHADGTETVVQSEGILIETPEQLAAVLGTTNKSWKVEVIADNSGKWVGNGMRYANQDDALAKGADLASRWTLVREWRVVPSEDEPNA